MRIALMADSETNLYLTSVLFGAESTLIYRFNHPQQLEDDPRVYDIIIVDTTIQSLDVMSAIKSLLITSSQSKVIAICTEPNIEQARNLIRMGVTGVLLRNELTNSFTYLAQTVYAGRIVISPSILTQLLG